MRNDHLKKLVTAALFAALTCVATIVIQIPTPTQGYVNMGDCIVLLSGWLLGGYGIAAAAVGSMLADILLGYMQYAPATFLIKGAVAAVAFVLFYVFSKLLRGKKIPALLLSGIFAECIMILGYFAFEAVVLEYGLSATAGITANGVQAIVGIAAGMGLYPLFEKMNHREM